MHLILFDPANRQNLFPFTHTRPVADIRCGILTFRERWEKALQLANSSTFADAPIQAAFPIGIGSNSKLLVNASGFANAALATAIQNLHAGETLFSNGIWIAAKIEGTLPAFDQWAAFAEGLKTVNINEDVKILQRPWDIFSMNDAALRADYEMLTMGRASAPIPEGVRAMGAAIFIEEGALIQPGTILNTTTGPVYLGKHSEIMEGSIVRGPLAMCEGAVLKMGAKVYGATTIGPGCKVGGEVNNVVFFANSNKGHDGFLGNAVIGEWCNLGADTNCSNLKNNYDEVSVYNEATRQLVKTGLTFCGLLMGDHSKCSINTMFNTGTVVGVSCNIYGAGLHKKIVPSFTWGEADHSITYQFNKAIETANRMMARRGKTLSEAERNLLQQVFENTAALRPSKGSN